MSFLRPIAALSIVGLSAGFAQPPGQPLVQPEIPGQPPIPAVPGQPAPPAAPPVVGNIPLEEQKITEPIVEPKLSGTALAGLYRKYTGRRVIVSSQAALAEFSFVQDASPTDPLTYPQVAELLKKSATIENFVFVPDSTDPNLDILTYSNGGLNPKSRGVPVFTEGDKLPEGDAVISYVMNLQYLKPEAAMATFNQVVGQFGAYGSIAPVANASAVIITENTSLIRKLIDLKKEIDVPGGKVATRFIKVEYADVTELAATLNELLNQQQQSQKTAGVQRTGGQINPVAAPQGVNIPDPSGGGSGGEENPPQIVPEPRTNRIFAMGRPNDLVFIESLVREFDIQTDQRNFMRRKLKFVKVSEFLPIARNALSRAFSAGTDAAGGAAGASGGPGGQGGGAGMQGNRSATSRTSSTNRSQGMTSGGSFGGGGSSGSGGLGSSGGLSEENVSTAPESDLVGRTLLVADNITNSIVVQGPPTGLEIIEQLLDQIDVKADQVMLSCVFGQLTLTDGYSFGVDYALTMNKSGNFAGRGGSGGGLDKGINLIPGTSFNPGVIEALPGLGLYGNIGNRLNVYLNAKQEDSNFKVLSRPTIFTANNKKGSIVSGTQIAVPTSSYSSGNSATNSTNFEYKDVAIQLEVIPLINSSNEVTLQIYLTSDDVGANRSVGTGANAYTIPDILKRELITTATVPNGETIALGGLITETLDDGRSGIPVLNRIPLVGPLFGSRTKDKRREELLIFIQPLIVNSGASLDAAQTDMDSRYKTAAETRRFSDGPGVLPPPDVIVTSDKTGTPHKEVLIVEPPAKKSRPSYGTRFRGGPF